MVHLFIGKRGSVTAEIVRTGCVVFIVVRKSMIKRFETELKIFNCFDKNLINITVNIGISSMLKFVQFCFGPKNFGGIAWNCQNWASQDY